MDRVAELTHHWQDGLKESPQPTDQDPQRHGTALAILLLQLAPEAVLSVIRIAKDSAGLLSAKAATAAVRHLPRLTLPPAVSTL